MMKRLRVSKGHFINNSFYMKMIADLQMKIKVKINKIVTKMGLLILIGQVHFNKIIKIIKNTYNIMMDNMEAYNEEYHNFSFIFL